MPSGRGRGMSKIGSKDWWLEQLASVNGSLLARRLELIPAQGDSDYLYVKLQGDERSRFDKLASLHEEPLPHRHIDRAGTAGTGR